MGSLEDLIEEIVGEIHDEFGREEKMIDKVGPNIYVVDGRMSLKDVNDRLGIDLPEGEKEYDTIGGLLHSLAGKIPEANEEIVHRNFRFTILKNSQRRIRMVRVRRTPDSPSTEETST